MNILVCGGAGYIGSHLVKIAISNNHNVTIIDNLSSGHLEFIRGYNFHCKDIRDFHWLKSFLAQYRFDVIIHLCAKSIVSESNNAPFDYYNNNVAGLLSLLRAMNQTQHENIIFSSSAAIYGNPKTSTISESHPKEPINTYGMTKYICELILQDTYRSCSINSVALRYFNAAGAHHDGDIGEAHDPETHLIPNVIKSILEPQTYPLYLYGVDHDTKDGSCVRDYIHVCDLADAHLKAAEFLITNSGFHAFNLGSGIGHSVLEVVDTAQNITNSKLSFDVLEARIGDPPILVANPTRAIESLKWRPIYSSLENIIQSAFYWHSNNI